MAWDGGACLRLRFRCVCLGVAALAAPTHGYDVTFDCNSERNHAGWSDRKKDYCCIAKGVECNDNHQDVAVDGYAASDSDSEWQRRYWIGGPNVLICVAGLTFLLSVVRLVDDPSFSPLGRNFDLIQNKIVPIVVVLLALLMCVCVADGKFPGSDVVPPGDITKIFVLASAYIVIGLVSYHVKAFVFFVSGSVFGSCFVYFLAYVIFSVNPERNPMLDPSSEFQTPKSSLSFYLFLVPTGFALANVVGFCGFSRATGWSRLTAAKITAVISFLVIQIAGRNNYPGFQRTEYFCYLTGSLGLYVFTFTGMVIWTEAALLKDEPSASIERPRGRFLE